MKLPKPIKISLARNVSKTGKLPAHLRPAAFCDTSFLIDYWNSKVHDPTFQNHPLNKIDDIDNIFIDYLKSDSRTRKIYSIREKIEHFKNETTLVYTPACRLEMEEVFTSLRFKKYGTEVTNSAFILKKGSKEIGELVTKIKNDFLATIKLRTNPHENEKLKMLYWHFFHTTDRIGEGLEGIIEVDILNFNLRRKDFYKIGQFANQQVAFADIFHLMTASKLGCQYFFSLDSDFTRIAKESKELFQIEIINDPTRMLALI